MSGNDISASFDTPISATANDPSNHQNNKIHQQVSGIPKHGSGKHCSMSPVLQGGDSMLGSFQLRSLLKLSVVKGLRIFVPLRSQREPLSAEFTQYLLMCYLKIYQLLKTVLHDIYLLLKIMNTISLRQKNMVINDHQKMVSITVMGIMRINLNMNRQY